MSQKITKSARTVSIASRLEHDIIIHLDIPREQVETGQFGSKVITANHPDENNSVMISGKQRPRGEIPENYRLPEMINGCAITRNVPAELWEKWRDEVLKGPGIGDAIRNGVISVYVDDASLRDGAKDHKDVLSGLEPINPTQDHRVPKPISTQIGRITPDDRRTPPAA